MEDAPGREGFSVYQDLILSSLKQMRSLFSYVVDNPDKLLKEIASIVPSRHMVYDPKTNTIGSFVAAGSHRKFASPKLILDFFVAGCAGCILNGGFLFDGLKMVILHT